jgi:hypothetical protein
MKVQIRHIISCLLTVIFAAYFSSVTCFTHSHVVNGRVVVHSHLYFGNAAHTQSEKALELIFIISHTVLLVSAALVLSDVFRAVVCRLLAKEYTVLPLGFHHFGVARAPPFHINHLS